MKKKIIFLSNGNFSVPTLKYLINNQNKYNLIIKTIITSKKNIINNENNYIKQIALKNNINIIYSEHIYIKKNIKTIINLKPDLLIVISFKYLKQIIWKIPKLGTINIHPSLLPQYKGANPINWVIINGEQKTGLTSFFINKIIDSGNIILQKIVKINNIITYKKLYKLLSKKTKLFLIKTIKKILNLKKKKFKLAPKINNYYSKIYFNYSINKISNLIRGLPYNKPAWCFLNTNNKIKILNIYKIKIINYKHNYFNGKILLKNKNVYISVKNGYIKLLKCNIANSNKKIIKDIEIYNGLINYKNLFVF
ncbi:methionyl-tRNA formyltransferase [Candidatus Shikimatogenerans bostrichidophilus]|uniref:methionyl-tRNA formyltransferase n=1 Tax=Candidatus Shikimatogenerans bostrichidophilus TaxID=2943807 RepID=UPI002966542D